MGSSGTRLAAIQIDCCCRPLTHRGASSSSVVSYHHEHDTGNQASKLLNGSQDQRTSSDARSPVAGACSRTDQLFSPRLPFRHQFKFVDFYRCRTVNNSCFVHGVFVWNGIKQLFGRRHNYIHYYCVPFCSFPALSCESASVDVSDVLGTNRLNMTKTECKFSIDGHLNPTGTEFHPGPIPKLSNHGDEVEEEFGDRSLPLTAASFDKFAYQFPVWLLIFMPLGVIGVITWYSL